MAAPSYNATQLVDDVFERISQQEQFDRLCAQIIALLKKGETPEQIEAAAAQCGGPLTAQIVGQMAHQLAPLWSRPRLEVSP